MATKPTPTTVVHCRRVKAYDVYIGRACYGFTGSKWGNPFRGPGAVAKFRAYIRAPGQAWLKALIKTELKGRVLGCWCKDVHDCKGPKCPCKKTNPCHGDVLAELADEGD